MLKKVTLIVAKILDFAVSTFSIHTRQFKYYLGFSFIFSRSNKLLQIYIDLEAACALNKNRHQI